MARNDGTQSPKRDRSGSRAERRAEKRVSNDPPHDSSLRKRRSSTRKLAGKIAAANAPDLSKQLAALTAMPDLSKQLAALTAMPDLSKQLAALTAMPDLSKQLAALIRVP